MKSNSLFFRKFVYLIIFAALCSFVFTSTASVAIGQKRPGSLNQGTTPDDRKLCLREGNRNSEFCQLYNIYDKEKYGNTELARKVRNEMIDLVQSQIEVYFKARKDDRKKTVAILQMIFDVLEIGTAAATGIINGTLRAKSVMAQALSGFQAGRTAFNKNFDILQTQVLINKMRSNRAEIALGIESKKSQSVEEYTWYAAKLDLTKLLNAGTFNDALDTLVRDSGDQAADSEKALADLKRERRILGAPTIIEEENTTNASEVITGLRRAYAAAANPANAAVITDDQQKVLQKYQNIYAAIKANDLLFAKFNKMPDDPDFDEELRTSLRNIIAKLAANPKNVTAVEYNRVLGVFINTVAADETLGAAYLKILTDNK